MMQLEPPKKNLTLTKARYYYCDTSKKLTILLLWENPGGIEFVELVKAFTDNTGVWPELLTLCRKSCIPTFIPNKNNMWEKFNNPRASSAARLLVNFNRKETE